MGLFKQKRNDYQTFILDLHLPCQSEADEEVLFKIIELQSKLSAAFWKRSDTEHNLYLKKEAQIHDKLQLVDYAMSLEKTDLAQAISIYESLVAEGYSYTANPYDRLAIIYRKAQRYDDEIRIIKLGLKVLDNSILDSFCAKFVDRLEKAVILREKNKSLTA